MATCDNVNVLVIGAGPSGAIAAALLAGKGYNVSVFEKDIFPRFSIGESLLPQCMQYIEEAGMIDAVRAAGFQHKNGAAFMCGERYTEIDFRQKFTQGWDTTYQVERARFDKILADEAQRMGADIRYGYEVLTVDVSGEKSRVTYKDPTGKSHSIEADFLLDASGFGRVLPRILDLNTPSDFPVRHAVFTHITDKINSHWFDREKILVSVHPRNRDVWTWLIPFSDGRASIGVVAREEFFAKFSGEPIQQLKAILANDERLSELLNKADFDTQVRTITGYSSNVKSLHGNNYALLGNAGEFLDPVFSSGVTIGMRSASMAAALLDRQFKGEIIDWEADFSRPLMVGINSFRTFVTAWYDQRFQNIIFYDKQLDEIKAKISSILAGYAWDEDNPYVKYSERRLNVLADICQQDEN